MGQTLSFSIDLIQANGPESYLGALSDGAAQSLATALEKSFEDAFQSLCEKGGGVEEGTEKGMPPDGKAAPVAAAALASVLVQQLGVRRIEVDDLPVLAGLSKRQAGNGKDQGQKEKLSLYVLGDTFFEKRSPAAAGMLQPINDPNSQDAQGAVGTKTILVRPSWQKEGQVHSCTLQNGARTEEKGCRDSAHAAANSNSEGTCLKLQLDGGGTDGSGSREGEDHRCTSPKRRDVHVPRLIMSPGGNELSEKEKQFINSPRRLESLNVKAADVMGSEKMRTAALERVPSNKASCQSNSKVADVIGEAKVGGFKAGQVLGGSMEEAQKKKQKEEELLEKRERLESNTSGTTTAVGESGLPAAPTTAAGAHRIPLPTADRQRLQDKRMSGNTRVGLGVTMKAAATLGDSQLEKSVLEHAHDRTKVNQKVLALAGEASMAGAKAAILMGDEMDEAQRKKQLQTEQEEVRLAEEQERQAQEAHIQEAMAIRADDTAVNVKLSRADKAAAMLGDEKLAHGVQIALPDNAQINSKAQKLMGGDLMTRKAAQKLGLDQTGMELSAATTIQSHFRGHMGRKSVTQRSAAAVSLQAQFRGYKARHQAAQMAKSVLQSRPASGTSSSRPTTSRSRPSSHVGSVRSG